MEKILSYRPQIESYIDTFLAEHQGAIYEPVRYILELGGKRLRPALVLAAADSLGADLNRAVPLAAAIEVFHNFTLLHDDIMDEADSRRGRPAVHVRWNRDQAILSGDIMFAMSYDLVLRSDVQRLKEVHQLFTATAKEVCIGQQVDMEFEQRDEVQEEEYLEMIRLKTSVLIGAAAAIGALSTKADSGQVKAFYDFGQNIGVAFQIQDDILDAFGEQAAVGKRVGGDILQNKKTLLYLRALDSADPASAQRLRDLYSTTDQSTQKVEEVKGIMDSSGALDQVRQVQERYVEKAMRSLERVGLDDHWKAEFKSLADHQLQRIS
ncbi:MAG: polyprenyl synthetase family protein [Flavobacteriales bacterium]|nr:polyprenyl synthetase family protein [Flavobacteriales bacterium]